ncbi:MAG: AraD1 family protein [Alphaproteobacteria bacterium]
MRLIQYTTADGKRAVGRIAGDGAALERLAGIETTYQLAGRAIAERARLADLAAGIASAGGDDYDAIVAERRLLCPVDHADGAHLLVTGTGLTHLGSAATRDSMHQKVTGADVETLTDSMKMFRMGLEGGKPAPGTVGVQPEWFYKGDGSLVSAPEQPLVSPAFADDGGEEPEVAGVYLIGPDGTPWRLGFALANEFSDHVMERQNYLWLAHSKLRTLSFGPELLVGDLPASVEGTSRIRRGERVIWEKPFLSGEANMSHTIANLEAHHFKYDLFRRPGDVHVHSFGTATLSFADGIRVEPGDVFEIEAGCFGRALRNPLAVAAAERVEVRAL